MNPALRHSMYRVMRPGCFAVLLALLGWASRMQAGPAGLRFKSLAPASPSVPGLSRLSAPGLGIDFTNRLSEERAVTNRNLVSGSGVALADVDGDGRLDVFLCGLDSPNAMYRNLGDWRFTNVTARALRGVSWLNPLSGSNDSTGAAFADVDGDGDPDLLVNQLGAAPACGSMTARAVSRRPPRRPGCAHAVGRPPGLGRRGWRWGSGPLRLELPTDNGPRPTQYPIPTATDGLWDCGCGR